jgi:hypothetical protein
MGTMIQRHRLEEADYRGARFADWPSDVKGNNDLLVLTRPEVIREIHSQYLAAGADILETNTFNANSISMADYGMEALVHEINLEAAKLARSVADEYGHPGQAPFRRRRAGPHFPHRDPVAGRERSRLPQRHFDQLVATYYEATDGLVKGGADLILIETVFDTLNAKAAVFAVKKYFDDVGQRLAHHDLRHHHRRLRPHPVGPDRGGLLEQPAPRRAPVLRFQLRPGRQGTAPARRGDRPQGRLPGIRPPQRRPAQRLRRLRRVAATDGGTDRRMGPLRPAQHRRRLLRHHPRAHQGHRRGGGRLPAPTGARNPAEVAPLRPGSLQPGRRRPVRATWASAPTSPAPPSSSA